MKRLLFLIISFSLPFVFFGQSVETPEKVSITYSPLNMLRLHTPTINIGLQYEKNDFAIHTEYGFRIKLSSGYNFHNQHYWALKSTAKYYREKVLWGLGFNFLPHEYTQYDSFVAAENGDLIRFTKASFRHSRLAIFGAVGKRWNMKNDNWFIEANLELGPYFRNLKMVSVNRDPQSTFTLLTLFSGFATSVSNSLFTPGNTTLGNNNAAYFFMNFTLTRRI